MMRSLFQFLLLLMVPVSAFAVDSYRYAHVTIETPWTIFVFLLLVILLPFILMAVLYWYFASRKPEAEDAEADKDI
jgi:hypothetical protein